MRPASRNLILLYLTVDFVDIATAGSVWLVCPVAGNVVDAWTVYSWGYNISR